MKLWKNIGGLEFDLQTVFWIKEELSRVQNSDGSTPIVYRIKLINGDIFVWTVEEKAQYDREIALHNKIEQVAAGIDAMKASYVGRPIGG